MISLLLVAILVPTLAGLFLLLFPSASGKCFRRVESFLSRFANSRLAPFAIVISALVFSCLWASFLLLPEPRVSDEFSSLLNADTFCEGRLTNPPHPMWKHFESFHIIQHPTYNSKYPPGKGLFLAVGQLAGHPILGVWLSMALAAAAIFWMLNSVFPKAWSLTGTALALFNPQVMEWNWNYWGGTVSLLGGAIFLGGFWRNLKKPPELSPSAMMGLGAGVLALNRPFEGFVLCCLAGVALLYQWRKSWNGGVILKRFVIPLTAAAMPFLAFNGYYNFRVTGHPLTMPYAVYENQYSNKPLFIWGSDRPTVPSYHNEEMRFFYYREDLYSDSARTSRGFVTNVLGKLQRYDEFFWHKLAFVCLIPIIAVARREPRCRLALWLFLLPLVISVSLAIYTFPHYTAPIFPLLLILLIFGLRELHLWKFKGRRWGRLAARVLIIYLCIFSLASFADRQSLYQRTAWEYRRAAVLSHLEADGKKHLVIVKYGPGHVPDSEWVYNRADIDNSRVVWARDLGEAENRNLLNYFNDREVLILEPDNPNHPFFQMLRNVMPEVSQLR